MSGFSSIGRGEEEWVDLEDCEIFKETEKALLIGYEGEEHWVPKSQIEEPEQFAEGDSEVDVRVKAWFARKEEII